MNQIQNPDRVFRLIRQAIRALELDLRGRTVLTEAASGAYVVTPLIAAAAGANVIAVTRDSSYGTSSDVIAYAKECAEAMGVARQIEFSTRPAREFAGQADIVTNLGFVRPIDRAFVSACKIGAVVPLMWETWEYRKEDVDLDACRERGIPVLGTRETDPRLQIFKYVGQLAIKLMMEAGLEAVHNRVLVVGGGHFGKEITDALASRECAVVQVLPKDGNVPLTKDEDEFLDRCDAIVIAEHTDRFVVLGGDSGIPIRRIAARGRDVCIIHICGAVADAELRAAGLTKHPAREVPVGYMTVATDYVGPKPVVDLHTAGLKVGDAMWRGLREHGVVSGAIEFALSNSPAMK